MAYDAHGRDEATIDALGGRTTYVYDILSQRQGGVVCDSTYILVVCAMLSRAPRDGRLLSCPTAKACETVKNLASCIRRS